MRTPRCEGPEGLKWIVGLLESFRSFDDLSFIPVAVFDDCFSHFGG